MHYGSQKGRGLSIPVMSCYVLDKWPSLLKVGTCGRAHGGAHLQEVPLESGFFE